MKHPITLTLAACLCLSACSKQQQDAADMSPYIMTEDACLQCHGDPAAFSNDLSERLAMLYPDDQAIGFKLGEL